MPHKARKIRKYRGSRTHGYGQIGQHRCRGGRGGTGKAGFDKHKWTYILRYNPDYWKKKGFISSRTLGKKVNIINVGQLGSLIEKLATENKLDKKEKKVFLDLESLGFDKLLGTGEVVVPMIVKVGSYSEAASRKLEEAGGEIFKEDE